MTGAERKRRWRLANPERERALSYRQRREWYARGGWSLDEQRHRATRTAARQRQREELFGT